MSDFVLITDATADLAQKMLDEMDIHVIPMEVVVGEMTFLHYPDGRNLGFSEFYDSLRKQQLASTVQINVQTYMDIFEEFLKDGKDVLYIAFSSALSGSFNSSLIAMNELRQSYPERKLYCVDSLCASTGEGFLVYHAALERDKGKTIDEVKNWAEESRLKINHWFTVDDLNHLKRGGRVSPTVAFAGTLLGIKPLLHVNEEGHLLPVSKVRGRAKALEGLVEKFEQTAINPEEQVVFISHGDCLEDALIIEKHIRERVAVKDVVLNYIGPVIGAHSGPGTVAIFFFANKR